MPGECWNCGQWLSGGDLLEGRCWSCGADVAFMTDGGTETIDEAQTVREAAQPDETVADRLRQARHCWPLLKAVTGRKDPEELTYEDWVRPMKLTGGKVCLRVDATGKHVTYVRRNSAGMLVEFPESPLADDHEQEISPRQFKDWIEQFDIKPVLVEDTPYGEDEDV